MPYVITYRDEDGRHFWMGGNCWSSDRADALTFLTPAYAAKLAAIKDEAVSPEPIRSRVSAADTRGLVVVTSLRHEELYGWRIEPRPAVYPRYTEPAKYGCT